jgi:signal transduction histidine kinase
MRISPRLTLGVLTTVVIVALVAFAVVLVDSQETSRSEIEDRFRERANASAQLTASLFESASATAAGNNAARFGGPTVSAEALGRRATESNNLYLLVLDARGEILAASPGTPDRVRADIAARPAHIRAVLAGRPFTLSDLRRPQSGPSEITFSQPFPSPLGRRVLVSGLDGRFIGAFLAGSLRRLPKVRGGRQYVVDSRGVIIGTPAADQRAGTLPTEPGLAAALRTSSMGHLRGTDRRFVAQRIPGTPWRVVRTAPEDALFASVQGINKWGPWLLFAAFALAAAAVIVLVRSVLHRAAAMTSVNAQLAESNATLEDRARDLARANQRLEWTNVELGRSNEELERFASVASHDLQEPLRKVRMFSERITHHDGAELSERSRDYLERMSSAAERMQDLIDGLLQYSRVTMQATPSTDVDLERVAHEVVGDLEVAIRDAGARVDVGSLPHVSADALQMRQLLQNLIANALKFRRPDVPPVVRLDGRVLDDTVEITVSDNGIGIEPRYAERIFNVFERLHPRTAYPGTGMGLALCRRIAERHHGAISVESTPGEGSTFIVTLPRDPTDRHAVQASADRRKEEERLAQS